MIFPLKSPASYFLLFRKSIWLLRQGSIGSLAPYLLLAIFIGQIIIFTSGENFAKDTEFGTLIFIPLLLPMHQQGIQRIKSMLQSWRAANFLSRNISRSGRGRCYRADWAPATMIEFFLIKVIWRGHKCPGPVAASMAAKFSIKVCMFCGRVSVPCMAFLLALLSFECEICFIKYNFDFPQASVPGFGMQWEK